MAAHEDDRGAGGGEGQAAGSGAAPEDGERIAKVLARAGVASRRDVERLIAAGRVSVNGAPLTTPAFKVSPSDRVTLDGRPVKAAEATRLFRYHKPPGLVTTHRDPQGRPTVFEALPKGLPRLISVGRLDLNSEGLLLLTNDGELARRLELPSSGLMRRYRARARGAVDPARLAQLKDGITVAGVRYGPIEATLEPGHDEGGANQWLVLSLAEGKNREVRKVLEALGLTVNRLIRLAYGPYELGTLARGEVQELPSTSRSGIGGGGAGPSKPLKARRANSPAPTASPPKADGPQKLKRKAGWAKPKVKPARSGSAAGPRAGPRGPKPSASPHRSSPARPPGPRPGGGRGRRG
jgi:23S rRNA pseudouridine2605 synthase